MTTTHQRIYAAMGGVDLASDPARIAKHRFALLENLYRDYDGDFPGATETFPGTRLLHSFSGILYGIHPYRVGGVQRIAVHAGNSLHTFATADRDTLSAQTLTTYSNVLAAAPSTAFCVGDDLYLLDGTHLLRLREGELKQVGEGAGEIAPYLPLARLNGAPYEQRNLLTDRYRCRWHIGAPSSHLYATPGLYYTPTGDGTCEVSGGGDPQNGVLVIPASVTLEGKEYRVSRVANFAFRNRHDFTSLRLGEEVTELGAGAFLGTSLTCAYLPPSLLRIGNGAFQSAPLTEIWLPRSLQEVGLLAFQGCSSLADIYYAGTAAEWSTLSVDTGNGTLSDATLHTDTVNRGGCYAFAIEEPCASVEEVRWEGSVLPARSDEPTAPLAYALLPSEEDPAQWSTLLLYADDGDTLTATRLEMTATAPAAAPAPAGYSNFRAVAPAYTGSNAAAVEGCTVAVAFDGRHFFTGHPSLPGLVFYTQRDDSGVNNPLYVGALNYFRDGDGRLPLVNLLPTADMLVAIGPDGPEGALWYHVPTSTGEDLLPRIYPATAGAMGMGGVGAALCFRDDPVFLSARGLLGIGAADLKQQRVLERRSSLIDPRLCALPLAQGRMTVWKDYLCLLCDGTLFLADSRQPARVDGVKQYEWYPQTQIGSYRSDHTVYRFARTLTEESGCVLSALPDTPVPRDRTVYSGTTDFDDVYTYVIDPETGERVEVCKTDERYGGEFTAADRMAQAEGLLYFGTPSGVLFCTNHDKRGLPPQSEADSVDFDAAAYAARFGRRIDRAWYSRMGHAYRSACRTCREDGGCPQQSKRTVHHTGVLQLAAPPSSAITLEVQTDGEAWTTLLETHPGPSSFADAVFDTMSLSTVDLPSFRLPERERRWGERQYGLWTDGPCAPFALRGLAFSFSVAGPLRRTP